MRQLLTLIFLCFCVLAFAQPPRLVKKGFTDNEAIRRKEAKISTEYSVRQYYDSISGTFLKEDTIGYSRYDRNGRLIESSSRLSQSRKSLRWYYYDGAGNCIRNVSAVNDSTADYTSVNCYSFNKKNQCIRAEFFTRKNGKLEMNTRWESTYSHNGMKTSTKIYTSIEGKMVLHRIGYCQLNPRKNITLLWSVDAKPEKDTLRIDSFFYDQNNVILRHSEYEPQKDPNSYRVFWVKTIEESWRTTMSGDTSFFIHGIAMLNGESKKWETSVEFSMSFAGSKNTESQDKYGVTKFWCNDDGDALYFIKYSLAGQPIEKHSTLRLYY